MRYNHGSGIRGEAFMVRRLLTSSVTTCVAWIVLTASAAHGQSAPDARDHWSFVPVQRPEPPAVSRPAWVRNAVDRFVLNRLDTERIAPAPPADRATLIRRVSLDLIGLPPTPDEVDAFLADTSPDAYERWVDRLLASPHYGERWARPWLDLARYADSDGYLTDQLRPFAWRYRHWLVDALNRDLPFDQFTIEQIAGDLLHDATVEQKVATGFHRNTLSNREGGADLEEFRVEKVVDRVSTTGTVWLGLTVGCARCHDHKYDPIAQTEFYQLFAALNNACEVNINAPLLGEREPYDAARVTYDKRRRELLAPVADKLAALQARWEAKLLDAAANPGQGYTWDRAWEVLGLVWGGGLGEGQLEGQRIVQLEPARRTQVQKDRLLDYFLKSGSIVDDKAFSELKLGELHSKLEKLKATLPKMTRAQTLEASYVPRKTHVHLRGNFRSPGDEVVAQTPSLFEPLPTGDEPARLKLARWLVSRRNPLTARVTVNRMWQAFFGRGLVLSSDDFGIRGARPSHPRLLDWLAAEFMDRDWSVKRMHRLIVTSATYRQASTVRPELQTRDPDNRLLARQSRLRLPAEHVRDASLAVSGLLETRVGGPSVHPPQPDAVSEAGFDNKWPTSEGADRYRRGLYTFIQRTSPFAQSIIFDAPDPTLPCARRERSNTPLQALTLLNDPVFFEAAQALARRALREQQGTAAQRIDYAFRVCVGRSPTATESDRLVTYHHRQEDILRNESIEDVHFEAWVGICGILLNLDEFITRE
jgi:hypothetical protein